MNYSHIKVFYIVAKLENISKAAEELDVTQPAISRIITSMEKEYNTKLFYRSKSGVKLTREGLNLFNMIEKPFEELDQIDKGLSTLKNLHQVIIHIGATSTALYCFLFSFLEKIKKKYPSAVFRIHLDSSKNVQEMLKRGNIDFAFITTPFLKDEENETYEIYKLNDILLAPISYRKDIKGQVSISELTSYPFILLNNNMQFREHVNSYLHANGVHINPTYETDSSSVLLPFVERGYGLTFIPLELAKESIEKEKCFPIDLKEKIPPRYITFLIKKNRNHYSIIHSIKEEIIEISKRFN